MSNAASAKNQSKLKILFVCMGNICRSPTAHGIFRKQIAEENLSDRIEINSAGTHAQGWHEGDPVDRRSIAAAKGFDCDISDLRSRQLNKEDFSYYDYLIAMDAQNLKDIEWIAPDKSVMKKVSKLLDYAPELEISDIPDPYYHDGFDEVYLLIDTACSALLKTIKSKLD